MVPHMKFRVNGRKNTVSETWNPFVVEKVYSRYSKQYQLKYSDALALLNPKSIAPCSKSHGNPSLNSPYHFPCLEKRKEPFEYGEFCKIVESLTGFSKKDPNM
jgi:hypothetical protein